MSFTNRNENNKTNFLVLNNSIIIPKKEIARLKRDFGFFKAFIDTNFTNAGEFFDKDNNYILKKELFPEKMIHYDNTGRQYIIKRNDMWKALPNVLSDYHVPNKNLGDFLANYLLFKTKNNSLFNPTVPEQETSPKPNGFFAAEPSKTQLKKTLRKQQEINKLRSELGENLNNNNYSQSYYTPLSNQELSKMLAREKREEEISELKLKLLTEKTENVENLVNKLENVYANKEKIARALHLTERATANRTKYGSKPGKLPGTLFTQLKQQNKEKRRTKGRKKQMLRKTQKQRPVENNYNQEYNDNQNYNEY